MKPDWDELMAEYQGNPGSLIADVDCTAEGKELCETHGVKGYPSIKYGDPDDLKDYNGGRTLEDFKTFAAENLGPQCGPDHMDLCSEAVKKKINTYSALADDKLQEKIDQALKRVEEDIPVMKKVLGHLKKGAKADL